MSEPAGLALDFLGRVIAPGDLIVYPNRRGSSLWMNKAEVLRVEWEDTESSPARPVIVAKLEQTNSKGKVTGHRQVSIRELARVTVVVSASDGSVPSRPGSAATAANDPSPVNTSNAAAAGE